ncbi:MAG: site-specific integrase, partial [Acinetobacter pittii]
RKQAGLEKADLTFHDSRHEAASLMAKRIKNALTLCKIFGWKDPKQALTYYNPTNDEILEELNRSSGLNSLIS